MNKFVLCFLVLCFLIVVIVSARCGAKSIPALSKTSGIAVDHRTIGDEYDKQTNREAPSEERGPFAIESFISSVKNADESLPGTIQATNMIGLPQIKEHNKVLATRMENLGINIDGVVAVTKASSFDFKKFSQNNLEWMVLGKVFFGSSTGYGSFSAEELFKELNMKIMDNEQFSNWITRVRDFQVKPKIFFGKLLWLIQHHNELNLDLADAAKMAFGSEYLNRRTLPISDGVLKVVTEQNIDRDVMESLIRQDIDSRKLKRKPFAIESFTSAVKSADGSLPRTEHEADMMDVSQLKERDKVLATRMEQLGIDIDGVVFVAEALDSDLNIFSLNNLEWMVLGNFFFEKAGSKTGYSRVRSKKLFKELNMEIIDNKEILKWVKRARDFKVGAEMVYGKMLWLKQHHKELNLDLADVAKMAFGSEYFIKRTFTISDGVLEAVAEENIDKHVTESLIRQDKDSTMKDIAEETLPTKATRKYAGEESQEQPTLKNRKIA